MNDSQLDSSKPSGSSGNLYDLAYGSSMGSLKGLQSFIIRKRVKLFVEMLNPQEEDKMLEVGCNDGLLLSAMSQHCKQCHGIDVNKEIVQASKNPLVQVMDASQGLDFPDNTFDKLYSCHSVEHVADLQHFFAEAARVLKCGGLLVIMFPWELFRGMRALKDSFGKEESPFVHSRKLHLHRLNVRRIRQFVAMLPLSVVQSSVTFSVIFPIFPDYVVALRKR